MNYDSVKVSEFRNKLRGMTMNKDDSLFSKSARYSQDQTIDISLQSKLTPKVRITNLLPTPTNRMSLPRRIVDTTGGNANTI